MKPQHALSAIVCALAAATAGAQTQAPGLWESSMTMKTGGGETDPAVADFQAQLAKMPPEQRKALEQQMASRGLSIGGAGHGLTVKVCISKEQAAKPAEPHLNGKCTQSDVQRSGGTVRFKFACTQPIASSGTGEWAFEGDKAYRGKVTSVAQVNGQARPVNIEMTGRWLAADCGEIKPRPMATAE